MNTWFITGTDTGVGKTLVAHLMVLALRERGRVAAMKPVSAGCSASDAGLRNDDAELLRSAANIALPYTTVNPYAFAPAIAPHIAARINGETMTLARIVDAYGRIVATQPDFIVIEGAGGWRVPINDRETMADIAMSLRAPVILVVGLRLGCLSHALLTVRDIAACGLPLAGWVANHLSTDMPAVADNIASLSARIAAPLLATIPFGVSPNAWSFPLDQLLAARP